MAQSQHMQNIEMMRQDVNFLNSEFARANNVIAERQAQGQDISAQQQYLNTLNQINTNNHGGKGLVQQAPQPQAPNNQAQFGQMENMLRQSTDAMFQQQQAMLGQARDQQIAELQKAYNDAVMQGQMSVRDAERAFQENSQAINQQAYQQAQATNLAGEERGIANSQQLMGLMAGDNQRKNSMINQNMTERDRRVADVKDRINNIKLSKDLDIGMANANYNYGLASARGQADQMFAENMFGVHRDDYQANRNYQMDLGKMQYGANLDLQKMNMQQRQVLEQMATAFGYDLQKMDQQQIYQLDQMAKQHGYDISKMNLNQQFTQDNMQMQHGMTKELQSIQQQYTQSNMRLGHSLDMAKMSQGLANDLKKIGVQNANQRANMEAQYNQQVKAEQQAYELSLKRLEAQYKPGTREYQVAQAQLLEQRNQNINDAHTKVMYEANLQNNLSLAQNPPTPPKAGWFGTNSKEQKEYEAQYEAYQRAIQNLQNPTGMAGGSMQTAPFVPAQGGSLSNIFELGKLGQSSHPYR